MSHDPGCPFCKRVAAGEFEPTDLGQVVSFIPLRPVTVGHRLFLPTAHVTSAMEAPWATGRCMQAAAQYARYWREAYPSFNLITSAGADATQTVMHLHIHLVPRCAGDGLTLPWTGQP